MQVIKRYDYILDVDASQKSLQNNCVSPSAVFNKAISEADYDPIDINSGMCLLWTGEAFQWPLPIKSKSVLFEFAKYAFFGNQSFPIEISKVGIRFIIRINYLPLPVMSIVGSQGPKLYLSGCYQFETYNKEIFT